MAKAKPEEVVDDEPAEEQPAKLELTQEELDQRIASAAEAARKEEREKSKKKAKAKKKEEEQDEDEAEEDPDEVVRQAEAKAATAEQGRAEAERELLMLKVKDKLRDYLVLNYKEFVGNTPDILLHVERALSADPKDAEVARLIESHAKAFVERTKPRAGLASGAPLGGVRRTPGQQQAPSSTTVTQPQQKQDEPRRFAAFNFF